MRWQRKEERGERQSLRAYMQCLPSVLGYQLISSLALGLILPGLRWLLKLLLYSAGRVAITSGDFRFLFFTWQGWLFLLLVLAALLLMMAIEINGTVLLAGQLLAGQRPDLVKTLARAIRSVRLYCCREGFVICVYIALLAPLTGIGLVLSRTRKLYVPHFITSVIYGKPLYGTAYLVLMGLLVFFGLRNIFLVPSLLLDRRPVREAARISHEIMRRYWKDFIWRFGLMTLVSSVVLVAGFFGISLLPLLIRPVLRLSVAANRFLMLFVYDTIALFISLAAMLILPFQVIELSRLYMGYRQGGRVLLPGLGLHGKRKILAGLAIFCLSFAGLGAAVGTVCFDDVFPDDRGVRLIAHRLGGSEGAENSLEGLQRAIDLGVWGFETDVQRSGDGVYVIHHDTTFKRLYGEKKAVSDMSWDEIRHLSMPGDEGAPVHPASLEEVLDLAKGKGQLFLEMKGPTADRQMCDDVISMVRERGMTDQCSILSLKYDLVSYVFETYPDIDTGFLYFFSYGNSAALNTGSLVMEEEAAGESAIHTVHGAGKKAIVWTVNTSRSAERFLDSDADAIITDEIRLCQEVQERLSARSDYDRVLSRLDFFKGNSILSAYLSSRVGP